MHDCAIGVGVGFGLRFCHLCTPELRLMVVLKHSVVAMVLQMEKREASRVQSGNERLVAGTMPAKCSARCVVEARVTHTNPAAAAEGPGADD